MKPIIGILGGLLKIETGALEGAQRVYVNYDYVDVVERFGASAVVLPVVDDEESIKNQLKICDGLILSGGPDIHPKYFNEEFHINLGYVDSKLDEHQIKITKMALQKDIPILGICRGNQLLNVVCGGSLYQDVEQFHHKVLKHTQNANRHEVSHKIIIEPQSKLHQMYNHEIWVNSYHHQSIKELGKNLKITSKSSDGIIESVEHIHNNFVIGVQWHPEMMLSNPESNMNILLQEFVKACKSEKVVSI